MRARGEWTRDGRRQQRRRGRRRRAPAGAAPATPVAPFPAEVEWVDEIAGRRLSTYTDRMRSCSRVTVAAHPAVSVPCGFTADGLPVRLRLVGRYGDEAGLLAVAAEVVEATGAASRRPAL